MNNQDNQTLWGRLVGIFIFVVSGLLLGWAFLIFQNTDLSVYGFATIPNRASQIVALNKTKAEKTADLESLKQSKAAVKYDIANHIETTVSQTKWSENINSLIQMFIEVRDIGKYSTDAIELSDFVVDQQRIGLRGKVRKLGTIYQENGVIDRLTKLDFVNNIQIPSYQKIDEVYEFQIQGEVGAFQK